MAVPRLFVCWTKVSHLNIREYLTEEIFRKHGVQMRRIVTSSQRAADYRSANYTSPNDPVDPYYVKHMLKPFRDGTNHSGFNHLQQAEDGTYHFSPERQALHDSILDKHLGDSPPQQKPIYTVLGGGPAVGKTSLVHSGHIDALMGENPVMVDPDAMKKYLPEFQQGVAQGDPRAGDRTHMESAHLARRLQAAAFQNHLNVVADGAGDGDPADMANKLEIARSKGYQINGAYATVPIDVAQQRALKRGRETGRYVPSDLISAYHVGVSKVLPQIAHNFDNLHLFDTTDRVPRTILSQTGGKTVVHDPAAYQQFLDKANEGDYHDFF